jgi:hypothetical protein
MAKQNGGLLHSQPSDVNAGQDTVKRTVTHLSRTLVFDERLQTAKNFRSHGAERLSANRLRLPVGPNVSNWDNRRERAMIVVRYGFSVRDNGPIPAAAL